MSETVKVLRWLAGRALAAGHPLPVKYADWRPGDQPVYISDIRKAERDLNWKPRVSMPEGVERLWRWVDANPGLFSER